MKILITGLGGFVGQHVREHLLPLSHIEIHGISQSARGKDARVNWHQLNLLDDAAVKSLIENVKPTHLLHLAWCTNPDSYWTSSENAAWLRASTELLQSFCRNGGQRFVGAGTSAEYEWTDRICTEDKTALKPTSLYGQNKKALFEEMQKLAGGDGTWAWGRVFWSYGPAENPQRLVPYVINCLLRQETARCTDGSKIRDYLHVSDVAGAFVKLVHSEVSGPINIGSGTPVSIKELVLLIAQKLQAQKLVEFAPAENVDDLVVADVKKLALLGFEPKWDLPTGLDQAIQWWQSQQNN